MRPRAAAFTLIKMIVIIVIIAAMVLMLCLARAQGLRKACAANLQLIGEACAKYRSLFNDYWTYYNPGKTPDYKATESLTLLYPEYAATPAVFRCPATNDHPVISMKVRLVPVWGRGYASAEPAKRGFTWFGENPPAASMWVTDLPPGKGRATSSPEWCSYGFDDVIPPRGTPSLIVAGDMDETAVSRGSTANHSGGCNFLYFDGHVAFKKTNYPTDNAADNVFRQEGGTWSPETDSWLRRP